MQRLFNYGSFLQAYGLKHILADLGHDVEFIDVRLANGTFLNIPPKRNMVDYFRKIARFLLRPQMYNLQVNRSNSFLYEYFPILGLTAKPNENTNYDAVVIGSDEVFSYAQFTKWGGTTMYFGEGVEADKILSFAASFGYTSLAEICELGVEDKLRMLLQRFCAVSVRDDNSVNIILRLTNTIPHKNLDPVLVYDFDDLIPQKVKYSNYILIYGYDDRLCEEEYVKQIREFATKHKKKIIGAGVFHEWCDININVTPFELLGYVKAADYVVSETFHGTVFSIKYQKNFAVIVRDSNRNKLADLLNIFGLGERVISPENTLSRILSSSYDADTVRAILRSEREKAISYFNENI